MAGEMLKMGAIPLHYGGSMLRWTGLQLEPFASKILTPPDIRTLRQERPFDDAHIGRDAVERGRKEDIPELEFTGEALLVAATLRAKHEASVRPDQVSDIVDMVLDAGIDVDLAPLVSDENADEAKTVIRENTRVIDFFPNKLPK
jgi:hypothetical protein